MIEILIHHTGGGPGHHRGATKQDLEEMEARIMAKQAEEAAVLDALRLQLAKANDEIQKRIADLIEAAGNQDEASPELVAAVEALKPVAQQLDDIVPDAPAT